MQQGENATGGGGEDEWAALSTWASLICKPWEGNLTIEDDDPASLTEALGAWWEGLCEAWSRRGAATTTTVPIPFGAVAAVRVECDPARVGTGRAEEWVRGGPRGVPALLSPGVPLARWHERYGDYAAVLLYARREPEPATGRRRFATIGTVVVGALRQAVAGSRRRGGVLSLVKREVSFAAAHARPEFDLPLWDPRAYFHADVRLAPPAGEFPGGEEERAAAVRKFEAQVDAFASLCARLAALFLARGVEEGAPRAAWDRAAQAAREMVVREYARRIDFRRADDRLVDLLNRKWLAFWVWHQREASRMDAYATALECLVRFTCQARWRYEEQVRQLMRRFYVEGLCILFYRTETEYYHSGRSDAWLDPRASPPADAVLRDEADVTRLVRLARERRAGGGGIPVAPDASIEPEGTPPPPAPAADAQEPDSAAAAAAFWPANPLFLDRDWLNASRRAMAQLAARLRHAKPPSWLWLVPESAVAHSHVRDHERDMVQLLGPTGAVARIFAYPDAATFLGASAVTEVMMMRARLRWLAAPGATSLLEAVERLEGLTDADRRAVRAESQHAVACFERAERLAAAPTPPPSPARAPAPPRPEDALPPADLRGLSAWKAGKAIAAQIVAAGRTQEYAEFLLGVPGTVAPNGRHLSFRGGTFAVDLQPGAKSQEGGWRFWGKQRGGRDLYSLTQLQLYMEKRGIVLEDRGCFDDDEAFAVGTVLLGLEEAGEEDGEERREVTAARYALESSAAEVYARLLSFLQHTGGLEEAAASVPRPPPRAAAASSDAGTLEYVRRLYAQSAALHAASAGASYLRQGRRIPREHVSDVVVERSPYLRLHVGLKFQCSLPEYAAERCPTLLHFAVDPQGRCWGLQRTFLAAAGGGEYRKMGWDEPRVAREAKKVLGSPTHRGAYWPVQRGDLSRHPVVYLAEGKLAVDLSFTVSVHMVSRGHSSLPRYACNSR